MVKFNESPDIAAEEDSEAVSTPSIAALALTPAQAESQGVHVPVSAGIGGRFVIGADGRRVKVKE